MAGRGGDGGCYECGSVKVVGPVTATSASTKGSGNILPRRSARRRIPRAALGESEYRGGAWSTRTADNEHAAAALRDTEVLCIQSSPRDVVPEFVQIMEDDPEVTSASRGEKPGNIFDNAPAGPYCVKDAREFKPERAALAPKTGPATGHAEVLAGESPIDEVAVAKTVARTDPVLSFAFSVGAGPVPQLSVPSDARRFLTHVSDIVHSFYVGPVSF